jgi:UDP-3-O-[3-hydroxymyristoyl] glucosamine N-acyltransferase
VNSKSEFSVKRLSDTSQIVDNSLLFVKDKKFLEIFKNKAQESQSQNFAVLFKKGLWEKLENSEREDLKELVHTVGTVDDVNVTISKLSKVFYDLKFNSMDHFLDGRQLGTSKIDPTAWIAQGVFIGDGVQIDSGVQIHPGCTVMPNSHIGEGTILFPNVSIYPWVNVGKNCIFHSQVVIGADGFGFNYFDGKHQKVYHTGGVHIHDEVEIGANSCVDAGTFSPTVIGIGSKLDNHVQVGHNCKLGRGVILCGHVAIGGSSELGDFCVFGGKSGMGHSMKLGPQCEVGGGSLVNCDWPAKTKLGGHPARELKEWLRGLAFVRKSSLKK